MQNEILCKNVGYILIVDWNIYCDKIMEINEGLPLLHK